MISKGGISKERGFPTGTSLAEKGDALFCCKPRNVLVGFILLVYSGIAKPALKREASLPASSFSQPSDGSSPSMSGLWPVVFTWSCSACTHSLSWECGARTHMIAQMCNRGLFQPNSSLILSSFIPSYIHSWVQGLGYQGRYGSCSHGLGASNLQSETHSFPPRTHRNDDTFLLLGQSSLLSEPKGADSLPWFQKLWF